MTEFTLTAEIPGVEEYRTLRVEAGLSAKSKLASERGLAGSLFAVCIRNDDTLIGMGRIIGDGGLNYEVVDMAVHPDFQRQGLGHRIMESLMEYIRSNAPESSFVCLIADHGAPALYKKFGFEPTAPVSVGMALRL